MESDLDSKADRVIQKGVAKVLSGPYRHLRPDAAQEARMKVLLWHATHQEPIRTSYFYYRVGYNAAVNELNRELRHQVGRIPMTIVSNEGDEMEAEEMIFSDRGRSASEIQESVTVREVLDGAFFTLTQRERLIFQSVLGGDRGVDICREFGLWPSTASKLISAIRHAIAALLASLPDDPKDPTDRPPGGRHRNASPATGDRRGATLQGRSHVGKSLKSLMDTPIPNGLVKRFLELTLQLPAFAKLGAENRGAPHDLGAILEDLGLVAADPEVDATDVGTEPFSVVLLGPPSGHGKSRLLYHPFDGTRKARPSDGDLFPCQDESPAQHVYFAGHGVAGTKLEAAVDDKEPATHHADKNWALGSDQEGQQLVVLAACHSGTDSVTQSKKEFERAFCRIVGILQLEGENGGLPYQDESPGLFVYAGHEAAETNDSEKAAFDAFEGTRPALCHVDEDLALGSDQEGQLVVLAAACHSATPRGYSGGGQRQYLIFYDCGGGTTEIILTQEEGMTFDAFEYKEPSTYQALQDACESLVRKLKARTRRDDATSRGEKRDATMGNALGMLRGDLPSFLVFQIKGVGFPRRAQDPSESIEESRNGDSGLSPEYLLWLWSDSSLLAGKEGYVLGTPDGRLVKPVVDDEGPGVGKKWFLRFRGVLLDFHIKEETCNGSYMELRRWDDSLVGGYDDDDQSSSGLRQGEEHIELVN
jgi:hypothetical protein